MEELKKIEIDLEGVSTKYLVDELKKREGVSFMEIEPYQDDNINVNGPCIVMTIID